jgi:HK97 gp10 family phage protein
VASEARERSITLKAVKAGAKVMKPAITAAAPKRTGSRVPGGSLKRSMGVKAVKGRKGRTGALAIAGPRTAYERDVRGRKVKPAQYAHLVEFGTRPHANAKGAKLVRKGKGGADVGQGGKKHPGAKARPFVGPASDANAEQAQDAIIATLAAETQKAIEKHALKTFGKLTR